MFKSAIMLDLYIMLCGLSTIIMVIALWKTVDYRKSFHQGIAGQTWDSLSSLIFCIFLGYLTIPFIMFLTQEQKDLFIAVIFLIGALYVLISLTLMHKIVRAMKGR